MYIQSYMVLSCVNSGIMMHMQLTPVQRKKGKVILAFGIDKTKNQNWKKKIVRCLLSFPCYVKDKDKQ